MKRVVVHVGYPKCGSTFLQQYVFAKSPKYDIVLPPAAGTASAVRRERIAAYQALIEAVDFESKCDLGSFRAAFAPSPGRGTIISEENTVDGGLPIATVLARIERLFHPDVVIIVVRRHVDVLRSLYDMYRPWAQRDGLPPNLSFPDWWRWHQAFKRNWLQRFFYSEGLADATAVFGTERVAVFQYEHLFFDEAEQARLAYLLDIDADEVLRAFAQRPANRYDEHAAKRLTRRLAGPIRGSWFLNHRQICFVQRNLARVLPARRTVISPETEAEIEAFYSADRNLFPPRSAALDIATSR